MLKVCENLYRQTDRQTDRQTSNLMPASFGVKFYSVNKSTK